MEQALVVASDPIFAKASVSAASTGICHFGAALCGIAGAFAAGWTGCEWKSRMCGKRKLNQVEADLSEMKEKARKLGRDLKVLKVRTKGRFRTQKAVLACKADASTVATQLSAKVDRHSVEAVVQDKVVACIAARQAVQQAAALLGTKVEPLAHDLSTEPPRTPIKSKVEIEDADISAVSSGLTPIDAKARKRPAPDRGLSEPSSSSTEAGPVGSHCAKKGRTARKQSPSHTAEQLLAMYPDRIPVVCKASERSSPGAAVHKLLLPRGMLGGELRDILTKRVKRKSSSPMPDLEIHISVNGCPLQLEVPVSDAYSRREDRNGFLEVLYSTARM